MTRPIHLVLRTVLAVAIVAGAGLPTSFALAMAVDDELEQKKAEQDAATTELQRMQMDLRTQSSDLLLITRDIEKTRGEISYAASQTVELDAKLADAQSTLNDRAVNLYRNPPDTLEMLLTTSSVNDLVVRTEMIILLGERDAELAIEVADLRRKSIEAQQDLDEKFLKLKDLRSQAEAQRAAIKEQLTSQRIKVSSLRTDVAELVIASQRTFTGGDPTKGFDKTTVISEVNFRDSRSMSVPEIQAFLANQPGSLARYSTLDHLGRRRSTAQMIGEAAVAWHVSPKVILATLQKEQSLLSNSRPSQEALNWAMGCGAADSGRNYQYQGFGKQIWWGAQKFDKNAKDWRPGITKAIDGETVSPANPGTFAQYRYTPHFPGVRSFWRLYWRYFGDPLG